MFLFKLEDFHFVFGVVGSGLSSVFWFRLLLSVLATALLAGSGCDAGCDAVAPVAVVAEVAFEADAAGADGAGGIAVAVTGAFESDLPLLYLATEPRNG